MVRLLLLFGTLVLAAQLVLAADTSMDAHVNAKLVAESRTPAPGGQLTLALVIRPQQGWHIYWKNPGENGLAPRPSWTLPAGVRAGELRHPMPTEQVDDGLISYIHENRVALLTDLVLERGIRPGTPLAVGLELRLAVCTRGHCLPRRLKLALRLVAGDGAPDKRQAGLFRWARAALPVPLQRKGRYETTASGIKLYLPLPEPAAITSAHVFPDGDGIVIHGPQRLDNDDGRIMLKLPRTGLPAGAPLSGVVEVIYARGAGVNKVRGYRFSAVPGKGMPLTRPGA